MCVFKAVFNVFTLKKKKQMKLFINVNEGKLII